MSIFVDISAKIKELDMLWEELMEGVTKRGSVLEDTLVKAERFWSELQSCQKAIDELRVRVEGIQAALGEPTVIEKQRHALMVRSVVSVSLGGERVFMHQKAVRRLCCTWRFL